MAGEMGPSALLERYENLLISNLGAVQSIESGLRNVSWLLPGRFQDAELASEGLYALLNVVSGYHDSLLSKHLDPALSLPPHPFAAPSHAIPSSSSASTTPALDTSAPGPDVVPTALKRTTPTLPPPSDHARYTKYWTARSGVYRKASRMLVTIRYIELLVEMVAKKKLGDRRRWNVVLGMESIKTVLRLILLAVTKRPVLSHPAPQREYDLLSLPSSLLQAPQPNKASPSSASAATHSTDKAVASPGGGESDSAEQVAAPPSGAMTTSLPPFAPLRSHLFPLLGALPEDHLPHPLTLLPGLTPAQTISEIIESSVTLVHVILLLRASKRRPSQPGKYSLPTLSSPLAPFVVALALSLLARYLRQSTPSKTVLQSEHNAGRDRQLAMRAFVTGPMWLGWTRPKIMGIVRTLERVPLVGLVGDLVEGYIPLVDEYFYYSS